MIPPQVLYLLISGGVNLATQLANKPKKQKSPTKYMDNVIANLRGDISKRETFHTMMRSNLGAIGKATSKQRREARYLGELKGSGGGILSAEMQRIQQGQTEAISRATTEANQAQGRETAGMQASLKEAEMMREQIVQRTREANRVQDQQFKQGLIQTGLQTAGAVGQGALQYGQQQAQAQQQQSKLKALIDSGMYEGDAIDQLVKSGDMTAETGIETLKMLGQKKTPTPDKTIERIMTQEEITELGYGKLPTGWQWQINENTGDVKPVGKASITGSGGTTGTDDTDTIIETKGSLTTVMAEAIPDRIAEQEELINKMKSQPSFGKYTEDKKLLIQENVRLQSLKDKLETDKVTARIGETEENFVLRLVGENYGDEKIYRIFEKSFAKTQSKESIKKLIAEAKIIFNKIRQPKGDLGRGGEVNTQTQGTDWSQYQVQ